MRFDKVAMLNVSIGADKKPNALHDLPSEGEIRLQLGSGAVQCLVPGITNPIKIDAVQDSWDEYNQWVKGGCKGNTDFIVNKLFEQDAVKTAYTSIEDFKTALNDKTKKNSITLGSLGAKVKKVKLGALTCRKENTIDAIIARVTQASNIITENYSNVDTFLVGGASSPFDGQKDTSEVTINRKKTNHEADLNDILAVDDDGKFNGNFKEGKPRSLLHTLCIVDPEMGREQNENFLAMYINSQRKQRGHNPLAKKTNDLDTLVDNAIDVYKKGGKPQGGLFGKSHAGTFNVLKGMGIEEQDYQSATPKEKIKEKLLDYLTENSKNLYGVGGSDKGRTIMFTPPNQDGNSVGETFVATQKMDPNPHSFQAINKGYTNDSGTKINHGSDVGKVRAELLRQAKNPNSYTQWDKKQVEALHNACNSMCEKPKPKRSMFDTFYPGGL